MNCTSAVNQRISTACVLQWSGCVCVRFHDQCVRSAAVQCFQQMCDSELEEFLPQLVQVRHTRWASELYNAGNNWTNSCDLSSRLWRWSGTSMGRWWSFCSQDLCTVSVSPSSCTGVKTCITLPVVLIVLNGVIIMDLNCKP